MTKNIYILRAQSLRQHIEVACACDTVENNTRYCDPRVKISEPCYQCGNRMGGFGGINNQNHWDIQNVSQVCCGAFARPAGAIIQPHRSLYHQAAGTGQGADHIRRHSPGV